MRTVVLHYHLFKNAGTSLDRILQKNFGDAWVTREFGGANDNSAAVANWIRSQPEAVAFSTHTAIGPLPRLPEINLVSVMYLRDPLERLRSAYRFERKQDANTWGANLAKEFDFDGYVRARLTHPADRQCRNFQTWRLATMVPGPEPEIDRARQAATQLSVLGLVDAFDTGIEKLAAARAEAHPEFAWEPTRANTTKKDLAFEDDMMAESPDLTDRLRQANANDLALLDWLRSAS